MDFSFFCKSFYQGSRNTINGFESQHEFVYGIFQACGLSSPYIPQQAKARALYSGKLKLTIKDKSNLLKNCSEYHFISFYKGRITQNKLNEIGCAFGLTDSMINEECLYTALYYQLIKILNDDKDDVVFDEYNKAKENVQVNPPEIIIIDEPSKPISLWIPDAEKAKGEQSEFKSFTNTKYCQSFIKKDTDIWGICSAKGVGKTFLLQIKRRSMNPYSIPQTHTLSSDNGWGTESIRIDEIKNIENASVNDIRGLWKTSIICYVIKCIYIHNSLGDEGSYSFERLPRQIQYILTNLHLFESLGSILNEILLDPEWKDSINNSYTNLKSICKRILFQQKRKDPIMLFIDKIDQAVLQPGAEEPECNGCYKDTKYDLCKYKDLTMEDRMKHCQNCEDKCCIMCEIFQSSKAGKELRVYGKKYGKRYEHIGQWQNIQLAIISAVDDIKLDFNSDIRIYYAIRQEAINSGMNSGYKPLGGNMAKIMGNVKILHYEKKEQEQIFYNTIKIQPAEYLYDKKLVDEGNITEGFVGIRNLCHPYVDGAKETLFESIYRHSFDRAREVQIIGAELSKAVFTLKKVEQLQKREEIVKRIIEQTAANIVFSTTGSFDSETTTYFTDKQILLSNYWANPNNFKKFVQEIDRNLLFIDDMAPICQKINCNHECDKKCISSNCRWHPFTMLYQIGLLGTATYNANNERDCEQVFLDSKDITYYRDENLFYPNENTLFIVHPALTKCIELNIRKTPIHHFKGFILGKGLSIPRAVHAQLLSDKRSMDKDTFAKKYYSVNDGITP